MSLRRTCGVVRSRLLSMRFGQGMRPFVVLVIVVSKVWLREPGELLGEAFGVGGRACFFSDIGHLDAALYGRGGGRVENRGSIYVWYSGTFLGALRGKWTMRLGFHGPMSVATRPRGCLCASVRHERARLQRVKAPRAALPSPLVVPLAAGITIDSAHFQQMWARLGAGIESSRDLIKVPKTTEEVENLLSAKGVNTMASGNKPAAMKFFFYAKVCPVIGINWFVFWMPGGEGHSSYGR